MSYILPNDSGRDDMPPLYYGVVREAPDDGTRRRVLELAAAHPNWSPDQIVLELNVPLGAVLGALEGTR